MAKSKYAQILAERGFRRMGKSTLYDKLLARDGKRGGKPSFTQSRGDVPFTYATDETHYVWIATKHVDLSDLGFNNISKEAHAALDRMTEPYRKKMN